MIGGALRGLEGIGHAHLALSEAPSYGLGFRRKKAPSSCIPAGTTAARAHVSEAWREIGVASRDSERTVSPEDPL